MYPSKILDGHCRMVSVDSQATTITAVAFDEADGRRSPEVDDAADASVLEPHFQREETGPPVKHTFIEFPVPDRETIGRRRLQSAPSGFGAESSHPEAATQSSAVLEVCDLQDCHMQCKEVTSSDVQPDLDLVRVAEAQPVMQGRFSTASVRKDRRRWPKITKTLLDLLGSDELPTIGSVGHRHGKCKPCAFTWKDVGCSSGMHCEFCHLCSADEKKRRRKAKALQRRARKVDPEPVVCSES
jgi:hypothetical protein